MSTTLASLLGKSDVIEDCRQQILRGVSNIGDTRVTAEIQLKDGSRRIFRAKSIDRNSAIHEIVKFVAAVEEATGSNVIWRLKGEKTYNFSTNYSTPPSKFKRFKKEFLDFFFGLDEE